MALRIKIWDPCHNLIRVDTCGSNHYIMDCRGNTGWLAIGAIEIELLDTSDDITPNKPNSPKTTNGQPTESRG